MASEIHEEPTIYHQDDDQLDLLWGAEAIARFTKSTPRQVQYQTERGLLPIKRQGRLLVASKSALRRHFGAANTLSNGQTKPAPAARSEQTPPKKRRGPGRASNAAPAPATLPTVDAPPTAPAEQLPSDANTR